MTQRISRRHLGCPVKPPAFALLAVPAALLAALLAGGCGGPAPAAPPPPEAPVTVSTPVRREVIEWDTFTGRLEAPETVEVRPRVGGYVTEAKFAEGALVKKDDLLFVIDPRPFQASADRAKAQVEQAKAKVELAKADYDQAVELKPKDAISSIEYNQRTFDYKDAQAALAAAEAQSETAQLDLSFTRVTAPISGRIGRKLVTPGNLVTGGTNGPEATMLAVITSVDPVYCYVDVDEASALKYQRLAREKRRVSARDARIPCFLQLANETDFPHEGFVDFVDNRVDPNTGTLRARGVFPNPDGELTPGYFGRLRVPGSGRYDALLVADTAIGTDQSQRTLLLVDPKTDQVEYRPVSVGPLFGGLRVVSEGLKPGEWVITNGAMKARPGSKVKPTLAPMPDDRGPGGLGAAGVSDENQQTAPGSPATRALPKQSQVQAAGPSTMPTTAPATMPAAG